MKKNGFTLVDMLVTLAIAVIIAAIVTPELKAHQKGTIDKSRANQKLANELVSDIIYVKDPRTQGCFAYVWVYGSKFTAVPCESIPEGMLVTAVIEGK